MAVQTPSIAACVTLSREIEVKLAANVARPIKLRPRARVIAINEQVALARVPGPTLTLEAMMATVLAVESVRWLCGDRPAAGRYTEPFIVHAAASRILEYSPGAPGRLAFLDELLGLGPFPRPDDHDGPIEL